MGGVMEKRYAIVRVDKKCPAFESIDLCDEDNTTCENCKPNENYGDTKEQLVAKVAQVITKHRDAIEPCEYCDMLDSYSIAKEIVEFLGVK